MRDYALWPLAGLMAGTTIESTVALAEQLATAPLSRDDRIELTSALPLLSGLRLPGSALIEALRRSLVIEEIWKESSFVTAIHDLAWEEGLEKGRAEGRAEALRDVARTTLRNRYGELSEDISAAINAASEAVLFEIITHIPTETIAEVRTRLGLT